MRINKNYLLFSSLAILILFVSFLYVYLNLKDQNSKLIQFRSEGINTNFEIEISNNINNIQNFLSNYEFIENFLIQTNNRELTILIDFKKPFAKNNSNQEIIFDDGSFASYGFFNQEYIDSIKLVDTSEESLKINNYLRSSLEQLKSIFNINQIKFIDDRRYNLYLDDNLKIMLPKKIDQKFLKFLEDNFDYLKKNSRLKEYIDLRNFHDKTIRAK